MNWSGYPSDDDDDDDDDDDNDSSNIIPPELTAKSVATHGKNLMAVVSTSAMSSSSPYSLALGARLLLSMSLE